MKMTLFIIAALSIQNFSIIGISLAGEIHEQILHANQPLSLFPSLYLDKQTSGYKKNVDKEKKGEIIKQMRILPAYFIQNQGQIDKDVKYYFMGKDTVYFTNKNIVFQKGNTPSTTKNKLEPPQHIIHRKSKSLISSHITGNAEDKINLINTLTQNPYQASAYTESIQSVNYCLEFLGANHTNPQGKNLLPNKINYITGNDSSQWYTNIPSYQEIIYPWLYGELNGIDLVYKGVSGGMKYEFIIHPGANPDMIRLAYTGIERLSTDSSGNLIIHTALGDIKDEKPYAYQLIDGQKVPVDCSFTICNLESEIAEKYSYGFKVSNYNTKYALIIDPGIHFSTYLGGSMQEDSYCIDVDFSGNVYITGSTSSNDFPITDGAVDSQKKGNLDAFVTKMNSTGSNLIYSTFIGGNLDDYSQNIAVGYGGNVYIVGSTLSRDFPTTSKAFDISFNGFHDVFVTGIDSTGSSLRFSTYLGTLQDDSGYGIAVDELDNIYITGYTSSEFPTTTGAYDTSYNGKTDVFVTKLDSSGSTLLFSTLLGGNGEDYGYGITLDEPNNVYITGHTRSSNFPVTKEAFDNSYNDSGDTFVTRLNSTGSSLLFSTFLGGNNFDFGRNIKVDNLYNVYIAGNTLSDNFPVTKDAFDRHFNGNYDNFLTKLNYNGTNLLFSTFLGGEKYEAVYDMALDSSYNVYITGTTQSVDYPTTKETFYESYNGGNGDVFITALDSEGTSLLFSTFLGGGKGDIGYGIALDSSDDIYVTGTTSSDDFPIIGEVFDSDFIGDSEAFVTKFSLQKRDLISKPEGLFKKSPIINKSDKKVLATLTIRNSGSEDSGKFEIMVYFSNDNILDSLDILKEYKTIKNIKANSKRDVKLSLPLCQNNKSVKGMYLIAVIDGNNRVRELAESNNLAIGQIQ